MIKDCFNMVEKDMSSESTKIGIPFEKVRYTWRWPYDSVDLNILFTYVPFMREEVNIWSLHV